MNKTLLWKLVLILAIVVVFTLGIFGIPKDWSGTGLLTAVTDRIHLGLDLKGGTHLILQVQVNDAVNVDSDNVIALLKEDMRKRKINYVEITKPDSVGHPDMVAVKGVAPEQRSDFLSVVNDRLPEYLAAASAENSYTITMKAQSLADLKSRAVTQAIQSTAMLEIRQSLDGQTQYPSQEAALQAHGGVLPPDTILLPGKASRSDATEDGQAWYVISRASAVSGRDLKSADPDRHNDTGQPIVKFTLTGEGGRKFYSFTSEHVGDSLAVVLDGKVVEVARINEPIRDQGEITGGFTEQSAKDLSLNLRSGALPASIKYLEERTVGPSLGADSIRSGVQAAMVGMIAVLVFMLIYYRGAGINADVALILNLIILLGFMGYFGAVLTLPGIAGVILTVGMGVDSNVLIFERIREEVRNGKTPPSAVEQGFSHAWITIVDTHVTTIVSAAILFIFGTGPVRGFATTLVFGLAANLFTAVFVSRTIFDWILSRKQRGEALSI